MLKKLFLSRLSLFIFVVAVYFLLSFVINKDNIFSISGNPYYTYQLDSFTHLRLNIISLTTYDLSFFAGKWYVYWGAAPVLFVAPFYLLAGIKASDVFYTLVAGSINVILFYFIIEEFIKYFKLKISSISKIFVFLSFAFASPNLYLSLAGRVWHTSQIVAILYLVLFLLFYFKFLNNLKSIKFFILALIFFNLAWLSRITLVFYLLFFAYPFYLIYSQNRKQFKKYLMFFLCLLLAFGCFFLIYNYVRFNNPLDSGIIHQIGSSRYNDLDHQGKLFSLSYLRHNIESYFLNNVQLYARKPLLSFTIEGNSIFSMYPLTLLLFFLLRKSYFKDKKIGFFLINVFGVTLISMSLLLLYFATGWTEFGSRYFLDVVPILFLSVLFVIEAIPSPLKLILLFYGGYINILGSVIFYK